MKKPERLLQLLTLLRGRRRAVTAEMIASELGVSVRTVYRDIQSLILSGMDIAGEAGVGFQLVRGADIAPIMFSETELEALALGMRLLKGWADDDLIAAADSAQRKIRAVLPERIKQAQEQKVTQFLVPDYHREKAIQFSPQIREAIDQHRIVDIEYSDADGNASKRSICPLGLMFWGAAWTVVAWCRKRQDYRLFRLDRLAAVSITDQVFEESDTLSFEDYVNRWETDVRMDFWGD
ncbi:MAG: YafY family protein [Halioglobus sp.]